MYNIEDTQHTLLYFNPPEIVLYYYSHYLCLKQAIKSESN